MDKKEIRKANSDRLDQLFVDKFGEIPTWVKAVHRTSLTIRYEDVISGEPRIAKVTPADVVDYSARYLGPAGFQATIRSLGPKILGDWRQIDELCHFCFSWFLVACPKELKAAAMAVAAHQEAT